MLSHQDLWRGVKSPELPDISAKLQEVRQLLSEGKAEVADRIYADELKRLGYDPDIGYPLSLGDLKITMPVNRGFTDYSRQLDMASGEITVNWKDNGISFTRQTFVSRADNVIATRIEGTGNGSVNARISLALHAEDMVPKEGTEEGPYVLPKDVECVANDGYLYYAARNDDGTDFGAVVQICIEAGDLNNLEGGIEVKAAESVTLLTRLFVRSERHSAWSERKNQSSNYENDYASLLEKHRPLHHELYQRTSFSLGASDAERALSNEELLLKAYQGTAPNALIEKMWSFGKYLLIVSSREGGQPSHLYGLWCGEYRGKWAFNMANVNLEMIYWQALSGGIPETLLPVFDYFDRMMNDFRQNARKLYGCKGIYLPSITTPPSGLMKTLYPHIIYWTGGGAWIAQHYYDYFRYTQDESFLRERAMPFMKEVADFYEDFLVIDNGKYVSSPSISPENNPANYWDGNSMAMNMETTVNATMDFALVKELLNNLIDGATRLGAYAGELSKWKAMLKRIPDYEVNNDGAVKEWIHPDFIDNYHHRHMAHIYPVFPGCEVSAKSDPDLFQAFEIAIRKRLEIGISEQTGWSFIFMAHIFSRMGEGDEALNCMDLMARSCLMNNLYTTHNDWRKMGIGLDMDWAPFQIDANAGWTSTVHELLVQSTEDSITLLPALPRAWKKGQITGISTRCGVDVSLDWNLEAGTLEIIIRNKNYSRNLSLDCPLSETPTSRISIGSRETATKAIAL